MAAKDTLIAMSMRRKHLISAATSFAVMASSLYAYAKDGSAEQILERPIEVPPPITKSADKRKVINEATKIEPQDAESKANDKVENHSVEPTIALALGGGGTRGAAHVGVIRKLNEAGIRIDRIVGNSMGSVVGGLYAAGIPLDDIEKLLVDGSFRKAYVSTPLPIRILETPFLRAYDQLAGNYAGLYSGKKYQKFLEKKIPEATRHFENLKVPFSAVATNLLDGKAYTISSGDLATAIHASSAISPILKPVTIDDKLYVDGAIRANLPAYAARQAGADIVIAILVDEPLRPVAAKRFMRMRNIASRVADVVLAVNDEHQLQFADIIINPDVSKIPVLWKNPEFIRRGILAGELATEKAIPTIRRMIQDKQSNRSATATLSEPH